jgi:hypothetical protein
MRSSLTGIRTARQKLMAFSSPLLELLPSLFIIDSLDENDSFLIEFESETT